MHGGEVSLPKMDMGRRGRCVKPIDFKILDGRYVLGIYRGSKRAHGDFIVKYREWNGKKWSHLRTPKHIHWAVDVLMKLHDQERLTLALIGYLLKQWPNVKAVRTKKARNRLRVKTIVDKCRYAEKRYRKLNRSGEYHVSFLIVLVVLLMKQEKTNYPNGTMLQSLLTLLKTEPGIFQTISTATY